tara:strand:+ start:4274 stop:4771 length:498 start_codon:yes stop_codon:yes gene_type:complete
MKKLKKGLIDIVKVLLELINMVMAKRRNIEGKADKANLLIIRDQFTDKSVLGKLYFNSEFYGHTLELAWNDNKKRVSCIPKGVYEVKKRHTEKSKYKYEHLHILDVPNREMILMHIGNYPKNSKGCILLGNTRALNFVGDSRKAFYKLMYDLGSFEEIELIIKNR